MQSDTSTSNPVSDAFFTSTLRYIQFQKQKGGATGEKYDAIKLRHVDASLDMWMSFHEIKEMKWWVWLIIESLWNKSSVSGEVAQISWRAAGVIAVGLNDVFGWLLNLDGMGGAGISLLRGKAVSECVYWYVL